MKIEKLTAARVNLSSYFFHDFDILVVPTVCADGREMCDCYLTKRGYGVPYYVYSLYESLEDAAQMLYNDIPKYLPLFLSEILKDV